MKVIFRLILALLIFLLAGSVTISTALDPSRAITQYIHNSWQTEDGLPQNSVQAIVQTRDGFIWLATYEGLVRFDGVRFTVFDSENTPQIGNNYLFALLEDREGGLWIGTRGGLTRYRDGQFSIYKEKDGLSSDLVQAVYQDSSGQLWVGTDEGLDILKNGRFSAFQPTETSNLAIQSIYEDRRKNLWIATDNGLLQIRDGKIRKWGAENGLPSNLIYSVCEDSAGVLWIGTANGLVRLEDDTPSVLNAKDGLPSQIVWSIMEDRDKNLWVGTDGGGLSRWSNGKLTGIASQETLSDTHILTTFEDREGSLWIGTDGGGLNRLRNARFLTFSTQEGLSYDIAWSIYQDRENAIWIGTRGGGLNRFKDGRFTSFRPTDSASGDTMWSLYQDRAGNFWVGTDGGLKLFKDGRFTTFSNEEGLADPSIRTIAEDRSGTLWLGTDQGLSSYKEGKFTSYTGSEGISQIIFCILEDREGNLWIGTDGGGLYMRTGDQFRKFTIQDGLSDSHILAIYQDSEGTLWLGTYGGGLNRFKDGKFTSFTTKQGLFNDVIFQILEDSKGNLWMSCNKGLFRVSKKELNDFAEGKIQSLTSSHYGIEDGMKSIECNGASQPAGYKTHDGLLWFPTIKGVVVVNPNHIGTNTIPPPVVIEKVMIDKKRIPMGQEIQIPPGRGELEFEYAALSFLVPKKVQFQYMLEGFDPDWVRAENRRVAYYTNIPPGNYRFRVRASNNDGIWNLEGASYSFLLQPHFYQTIWFYLTCVFSIVLFGAVLSRLRVRRLVSQTRTLENRVTDRTKELNQQKQNYATLVDSIGGIIWESNARTLRFSFVSREAERLLGFLPEEWMQDADFWKNHIHPEDQPRVIRERFSAIAEKKDHELEYRMIAANKDILWVRDMTTVVIENDQVEKLRGVMVDLTESKRAEEDRKKLEAQLLHTQKLESLGVLAGGIAHDFNNLLTTILGNADLAHMELPVTSPARMRIEQIALASRHAAELTRQMLAYSGKGRLFVTKVDLSETIREMKHLIELSISKKCVLKYYLEDMLPTAEADPVQIGQVIMNLVINASEAMEDRNGIISISTGSQNCNRSYLSESYLDENLPEGMYSYVEVADSGHGMTEETRSKIFDPFFTTKFTGRGLGLAAVLGIVRGHRGAIKCSSEIGKGTTFRVLFPSSGSPAPKTYAKEESKESWIAKGTILVVDDLEPVRLLAKSILESVGFTVFTAADGKEAVEIFRERSDQIRIVLLDITMPNMDGEQAHQEIRKIRSDARIVLCSGYSEQEAANRFQGESVSGFVQKPYRVAHLLQTIRHVLEQ